MSVDSMLLATPSPGTLALYASGWLGAALIVTVVVALWRAGEPADLDDDPWVRCMRVLREGR